VVASQFVVPGHRSEGGDLEASSPTSFENPKINQATTRAGSELSAH
jgi:hypothetical protein